MSRITPPVPNTTLTPAYSSVSSTAGFQSGDLVYFRDSNFGTIPNNAVTSANFPISANVNQNQIAFNTTVNWANYNPNTRTGSTTSRAPSVALLTNGNIAVAFAENIGGAGAACFRIIDQNGAVVVDRTELGFNSRGVMGVCALTGGGFAITSVNTSGGLIWHGVYSNTGTVVTAMASDSGIPTSGDVVEIRALSSGGYVIATWANSPAINTRVYSSTGVPGTSTSNSAWNGLSQVVITTFSDNTFAALYASGSAQLSVARYGNTGSYIAASTVTTDWYNQSGYDFITLSDGSGVILSIDSDSGSYWAWGRTFNQSTGGVGARNRIAANQAFQQTVNARPLSAGGFVATNQVPGTGVLELRRYNTSFGILNAVDLDGFAGYFSNIQGGYGQRTTILEGATFLTLVDNSYSTTAFTFCSMPYVQIDKSSINTAGIRRRFPATQVVTNISAPVNGYARSNSTPNAASFLAANTQTLTQSVPQSSGTTFALAPFVAISDNTITSHCLTDMTNGQFVISYRSSNGSVRFSVFNPDASITATITVTGAGTANNLTRCTCLGNGKLVVSWVPSTGDRINFSVFAAGTYTLLASGTTTGFGVTPSNPDSWNSSAGHDIAPFGNDSFVAAFSNSSFPSVFVFNDSAVYQSAANGPGYGSIQNVRVASNAAGVVVVKYYSAGQGQGYADWFFRNITTNSIFYNNSGALDGYTQNNWGEGMVISPYGSICGFGGNGSTRQISRSNPSTRFSIGLGSFSYNSAGVCVGQYGNFVGIRIDDSAQEYFIASPTSSRAAYGTSIAQSLNTQVAITVSGRNTNASTGSQAQIVNLYNDIYAFSYINGGSSSTGQIVVGFINTAPTSYSSNITAGVTPSNTALVPSPANGYYLAGVSASECAAGGTGVLQVNGAATLNSQYPAGTPSQAFDFNTPALDVGVRGTIAGRNMIISGGK